MVAEVDALDPVGYLSAMASAAAVLEGHARALDALGTGSAGAEHASRNGPSGGPVSPLPGAGSDLAATLSAAVGSAEGDASFAAMAASMTAAARDAATGRAGRCLAAFIDGVGEVLANSDRIDGTRLALCLEAGAERLAPRDDGRHPGGFVPVANAAADAALAMVDRGSNLGDTIIAAANAGIEELERGPVLDAILSERGVVDGAAAGFLLVLDSLASVVTGEPLPEPPGDVTGSVDGTRYPRARTSTDPATAGGPRAGGAQFSVSCRLDPHDAGVESLADLTAALHPLCSNAEVEPAAGRWDVHLEAATPGAVVELLAAAGTMREVRIGLAEADRNATASTGTRRTASAGG